MREDTFSGKLMSFLLIVYSLVTRCFGVVDAVVDTVVVLVVPVVVTV